MVRCVGVEPRRTLLAGHTGVALVANARTVTAYAVQASTMWPARTGRAGRSEIARFAVVASRNLRVRRRPMRFAHRTVASRCVCVGYDLWLLVAQADGPAPRTHAAGTAAAEARVRSRARCVACVARVAWGARRAGRSVQTRTVDSFVWQRDDLVGRLWRVEITPAQDVKRGLSVSRKERRGVGRRAVHEPGVRHGISELIAQTFGQLDDRRVFHESVRRGRYEFYASQVGRILRSWIDASDDENSTVYRKSGRVCSRHV